MKILIFLFSFIASILPMQEQLNYSHKSINKQIKKVWGWEEFQITEHENNPVELMNLGKFFKVNSPNLKSHYLYVGRVNSCRQGGCNVDAQGVETLAYEYFDYFILYDDNASIDLVKVFNYAATHGQEVTSKSWLKQFIGYKPKEDLTIGKNIDAISGATISVYGIAWDIQQKTLLLGKMLASK